MVTIKDVLGQESCLMCQNNGDLYCGVLHRSLKQEEVEGKPCLVEREEDRFEPVFTEFEIATIEATLKPRLQAIQNVQSILEDGDQHALLELVRNDRGEQ